MNWSIQMLAGIYEISLLEETPHSPLREDFNLPEIDIDSNIIINIEGFGMYFMGDSFGGVDIYVEINYNNPGQ